MAPAGERRWLSPLAPSSVGGEGVLCGSETRGPGAPGVRGAGLEEGAPPAAGAGGMGELQPPRAAGGKVAQGVTNPFPRAAVTGFRSWVAYSNRDFFSLGLAVGSSSERGQEEREEKVLSCSLWLWSWRRLHFVVGHWFFPASLLPQL